MKIPGTLTHVVTDAAGQFAYATNQGTNTVAVVEIATRKLVASIPVGSRPTGLDITADGTKLYVANETGNNISVIDVAIRHELRRIALLPSLNPPYPNSVAILANGQVVVGSSSQTSRPMVIDPVTDAITQPWDDVVFTGDSGSLEASRDRTRIVFLRTFGGLAEINIYTLGTNTWIAQLVDGESHFVVPNGDGSRLLLEGQIITNAAGQVLGKLSGSGRSGALAAAGNVGYRVTGWSLQRFDQQTRAITRNFDVGDSTGDQFSGRVVLSPDEHTAVVVTDNGLAIVDL